MLTAHSDTEEPIEVHRRGNIHQPNEINEEFPPNKDDVSNPPTPKFYEEIDDSSSESETESSETPYVISSDTDDDFSFFGSKKKNPLGLHKRKLPKRFPHSESANSLDSRQSSRSVNMTQEEREILQKKIAERERRKKEQQDKLEERLKQAKERKRKAFYQSSCWSAILFFSSLAVALLLIALNWLAFSSYCTKKLTPRIAPLHNETHCHKMELKKDRLFIWYDNEISRFNMRVPFISNYITRKAAQRMLKQIRSECHWYTMHEFKGKIDTSKRKEFVPEPESEEQLKLWSTRCRLMGQMREESFELEKKWHDHLESIFGVPI